MPSATNRIEYIPETDSWYVVQIRHIDGSFRSIWSYKTFAEAEAQVKNHHDRIASDYKPVLRIVFCLAPKDYYYGSDQGEGFLCKPAVRKSGKRVRTDDKTLCDPDL